MRRAGLGFYGMAAAMLLPTAAFAQPSIWDEAGDPETAAAYRALLAAESGAVRAAEHRTGSPAWRRDARRTLRHVTPHLHGSDPRPLLLWAELSTRLGDAWDREVIEALQPALADLDDTSLVGDGWHVLAEAAARSGEPDLGRSAYERALEFEWHHETRASLFYNRGDLMLLLGLPAAAEADYRRAIALSQRPETQALSHYGLGMALERQGDLPSALRSIRLAVRVQGANVPIPVLDRSHVYFVPEYDLYYYKALEAMALAREPEDPADRLDHLGRAVTNWHLYLMAAVPAGDRWAENAQRHLAACERLLEEERQPESKPRHPR